MTDTNKEHSPGEFNHIERNNNHHHFFKKLNNIKNPVILELGVNKGSSTAKFLNYINTKGGELYSIDIMDCSNITHSERFKNISTEKWNFLKSNDLDLEKILNKFPNLKNGIDLLYVDSYHDRVHVQKIIEKWFFYIKKFGYIFFDDTESCQYKKNRDYGHSINNDSIDQFVNDFHYRNYNQVVLTKYFSGSGLSELFKLSEAGTTPNFSTKVWSYNQFIGLIYLFLKKIIYFLKNKHNKTNI
tara:strand:+ start:946 stop:1674 length:729 start_codon:yes stop_codon:yes gene_type:complete